MNGRAVVAVTTLVALLAGAVASEPARQAHVDENGRRLNAAPLPRLGLPRDGATYIGGAKVQFGGSCLDDHPGCRTSFRLEFVDGDEVLEVLSVPSDIHFIGSVVLPTTGAVANPDAALRVTLTATDAEGATSSVSRTILPQTVCCRWL
jgi:hypothetical protein